MRWLSLCGAAFVACFAGSVAVYGGGAGGDPGGIVAYYADPSDRLRQIAEFTLLLAGCVCLLVFVVFVARQLVDDELLASAAVVSGGGSTLLLAVANALWAASAFTAAIERNYRISPATHLLFEDAGFAVVVTAMAFAIPFVAVVTVAARRSRRLPGWFAALGLVCVSGLATAYWYWPIAAYLAWIASASTLLLRSPDSPRRPQPIVAAPSSETEAR